MLFFLCDNQDRSQDKAQKDFLVAVQRSWKLKNNLIYFGKSGTGTKGSIEVKSKSKCNVINEIDERTS